MVFFDFLAYTGAKAFIWLGKRYDLGPPVTIQVN